MGGSSSAELSTAVRVSEDFYDNVEGKARLVRRDIEEDHDVLLEYDFVSMWVDSGQRVFLRGRLSPRPRGNAEENAGLLS